jgi:hypothetical protein
MRKKTNTDFIEKAREVHGDTYDYSLVDYKGNKTKVKIICKEHGIFEQRPNDHLSGHGCKNCTFKVHNIVEFIKRAREVHGNKYDYSLVEYKHSLEKVKIICPIHGIFEQPPNHHIARESGCFECGGRKKLNTKEFIKRAREVHGDTYDYSLVDYKNSHKKVKIICKEHGIFKQLAIAHMSKSVGSGCPKCRSSKGELAVEQFLKDHSIVYETQKRFSDCRNKLPLPFDFYLPEYNTCIEFDGRQHFEPVNFGNNERYKQFICEEFNLIQIKDKIKNEFCKQNNIDLLRISFKELNIQKVLEEKICQSKIN